MICKLKKPTTEIALVRRIAEIIQPHLEMTLDGDSEVLNPHLANSVAMQVVEALEFE